MEPKHLSRFVELQEKFLATSQRLEAAKTQEQKRRLLNELQRIVKETQEVLDQAGLRNHA